MSTTEPTPRDKPTHHEVTEPNTFNPLNDEPSYEKLVEAKKHEFLERIAQLTSDGIESEEKRDALYDYLGKEFKDSQIDGAMLNGSSLGLNYNLDEYFIELPEDNVLHFNIGGSGASHVETLEITTKEAAEYRKKALEISHEIQDAVFAAINNGGFAEKKIALDLIKHLEGDLDLLKYFLEEHASS